MSFFDTVLFICTFTGAAFWLVVVIGCIASMFGIFSKRILKGNDE